MAAQAPQQFGIPPEDIDYYDPETDTTIRWITVDGVRYPVIYSHSNKQIIGRLYVKKSLTNGKIL